MRYRVIPGEGWLAEPLARAYDRLLEPDEMVRADVDERFARLGRDATRAIHAVIKERADAADPANWIWRQIHRGGGE